MKAALAYTGFRFVSEILFTTNKTALLNKVILLKQSEEKLSNAFRNKRSIFVPRKEIDKEK